MVCVCACVCVWGGWRLEKGQSPMAFWWESTCLLSEQLSVCVCLLDSPAGCALQLACCCPHSLTHSLNTSPIGGQGGEFWDVADYSLHKLKLGVCLCRVKMLHAQDTITIACFYVVQLQGRVAWESPRWWTHSSNPRWAASRRNRTPKRRSPRPSRSSPSAMVGPLLISINPYGGRNCRQQDRHLVSLVLSAL